MELTTIVSKISVLMYLMYTRFIGIICEHLTLRSASESVTSYFTCKLKWKTSSETILFANYGVVADHIPSYHFDGSASLTVLLINRNLVLDALTRCYQMYSYVVWIVADKRVGLRRIGIERFYFRIPYVILLYSSMRPLFVPVMYMFHFENTTQAGNIRLLARRNDRWESKISPSSVLSKLFIFKNLPDDDMWAVGNTARAHCIDIRRQ